MILKVEERIECVVSKKVRYSKRDDTILTLPVPLEAGTNKGMPLFNFTNVSLIALLYLQLKFKFGRQRRKNLKQINRECEQFQLASFSALPMFQHLD